MIALSNIDGFVSVDCSCTDSQQISTAWKLSHTYHVTAQKSDMKVKSIKTANSKSKTVNEESEGQDSSDSSLERSSKGEPSKERKTENSKSFGVIRSNEKSLKNNR